MQSTQPATTIELVHSICRDSADHAIHGNTKYLPKSQNSKLMSLYHSSSWPARLLVEWNILNVLKQVTKQPKHSSFFFRQVSSKIFDSIMSLGLSSTHLNVTIVSNAYCDSHTTVFTWSSSTIHWVAHDSITFLQLQSHKVLETTHSRNDFMCDTIINLAHVGARF